MKPVLNFKKKLFTLLSAFLMLASLNAVAQKKSVYDVIPGSGPKKTMTSNNTVIFRKTNSRRNTYPVYTIRRKNLPPGQAKKIYAGSATDYAPGQVKKHQHGHDWNAEHGEKEHGEKEHGEKHGRDD